MLYIFMFGFKSTKNIVFKWVLYICFQAISAVCKITPQKSFKTSIKSDEEVKVWILLKNHISRFVRIKFKQYSRKKWMTFHV